MRRCFILVLSLFVLSAAAQKKYKKVITGNLTLSQFYSDEELKQWFPERHDAYHVNDTLIKDVAAVVAHQNVIVILGTWCSDSQREFPRLVKILEAANFPLERLHLYGVNKKKTLPAKIVKRYGITNVPTIIVWDGKDEVGRITEKPKISLEQDLSKMKK
jgi:thiol-disulfide isomerase/thioredoxin